MFHIVLFFKICFKVSRLKAVSEFQCFKVSNLRTVSKFQATSRWFQSFNVSGLKAVSEFQATSRWFQSFTPKGCFVTAAGHAILCLRLILRVGTLRALNVINLHFFDLKIRFFLKKLAYLHFL